MPQAIPSILPYRLHQPEDLTSGVVFASPHSGRFYPRDLIDRSQLDILRLRSSEDAFVDGLLATVPMQGATLIEATYPRAYVDLNRGEEELDPALIEGLARGSGGSRAAVGLGVVPRVVAGGREIYSGKITRAEVEARLMQVWRPYHACLGALMQDRRSRFGAAVLFDVHSMPSEATAPRQRGADVVLGDRYGTSAAPVFVREAEQAFAQAGLRVARNTPFAGAYIAQRYGRPAERLHVVQIEIARPLYMDEDSITPRADFGAFAALMEGVTAHLSNVLRAAQTGAFAAE